MKILIAGGTDGIGLSVVKNVVKDEKYSSIYILGRKFEKLDNEINVSKRSYNFDFKDSRIVKIICDITNIADLKEKLDILGDQLDIFVNTIGTFIKQSTLNLEEDAIFSHIHTNTIAMMQLTKKILPLLLKSQFGQMLICSSSLCVEPRETYGLQGASKVAFKYFIDSLRKELGNKIRIMTVLPASLQTDIFAKGGDMRDTSNYARPEQIADVMTYLLNLPENLEIRDLVIENRRN